MRVSNVNYTRVFLSPLIVLLSFFFFSLSGFANSRFFERLRGARRRSWIVEKFAITTWKYCGRPAVPVRHVPRRMALAFYPAEETFRRQDIYDGVTWLVSSCCTAAAGLTIVRKWASYRGAVQFLRLSLAYRRETRDDHCFRKVAPACGNSAHENFKRASGSIGHVYTRCPRNRVQKVIYNGILMVLRAKLDRWMTLTLDFVIKYIFRRDS